LVSEDAVNLTNPFCNSSSEVFEIKVIQPPNPPTSNGDLRLCANDTKSLSAMVPSGVTVNWFDAPTGGNLLQPNSEAFYPNGISGMYYAEAETLDGQCSSTSRTALQITYFEVPQVTNEVLEFCENTMITLHADTNINTATFLWNTGETTEEITVDTSGTYTVEVSNEACSVTKTIELNQIDNPVISEVVSEGNEIIVNTTQAGNFLYSLDGNIYQPDNIFYNILGGLYTVYVKERRCDEIITTTYLHFFIPQFFTPNNDGIHDTFNLAGIEYFDFSYVSIYNRYGKLLKSAVNSPFEWNGMFAGELLPTDDYWYVIIIDDQKFTGHFTLKR